MKERIRLHNILEALYHYVIFFILVAFVISCCMMLFFSVLTETLGIVLTEENVQAAAKLTFINVLFLSLLFTLFDVVRRKVMVGRPVKRITSAAQKIIQGNFDVRIERVSGIVGTGGFNEIIDCFNKVAEELAGTETLRTDFIANVSHELKTPLAVMQNYGTMLQRPGLSEEKRLEYSKGITDAARRLANLITNILKLNKLENQQIFPNFEEYDLGEQLCECLLQFENEWERKELNIETDIEDGVKIRSDGELLSLVWNNLISNAVKFTENGGTVSVGLRRAEDYAEVSVRDTGCGMTPEVGAHIFEKFYQGDTSHAASGNGLGLALVKRVVDIMQGEISVESVAGQGSMFTVRFRRS